MVFLQQADSLQQQLVYQMDHHLVLRVELLALFLILYHELPQADPFHVQLQVLLVNLFLCQVDQVSLELVLELKLARFIKVAIQTIQRVARFPTAILDLYLVDFALGFEVFQAFACGIHSVSLQAFREAYPLVRVAQLLNFPKCLYCFSLIIHLFGTALISFVSLG